MIEFHQFVNTEADKQNPVYMYISMHTLHKYNYIYIYIYNMSGTMIMFVYFCFMPQQQYFSYIMGVI